MLLSMPNGTDPADPDNPGTPTTPNSQTTLQPTPPPSANYSSVPTPQQRHRTSRSISSLNTITTAPATFAYHSSAPAPAVIVKGHSLEPDEDEADQTAAGIGAIMLGSGEQEEKLSPLVDRERTERGGSVSSQGTINAGHAFATHQANGTSGSQVVYDSRPVDNFLEFSPSSSQSHSSTSPTLPSIAFSQEGDRTGRERSVSNSSVESDGAIPVTAFEYDPQWPSGNSPPRSLNGARDVLGDEPRPAAAAPAFEGISTDAVVPEPQRSSMVGRDFATFLPTSANMGRSSSAQTTASAQTIGAQGMQRFGSSESMARQGSAESFMSGRTSASLFGGAKFPEVHDGQRPPRPGRSVSLQNPVHGFVSPTTSAGTISQRRARPTDMARTGSSAGLEGLQNEAVVEEEEGDDASSHSRTSPPWDRPSGQAPVQQPPGETGPGHLVSASLPTRIRALSQPGKRPAFPQYESERPAMPTMLSQAARSVSVSGPGPSFPRKNSFGGAALQAPVPVLGRTASGSSIGSDGTPLTAHFGGKSGFGHGAVNLMLGPPPVNASELAPVSPVRRPFQLMQLLLSSITQGGHLSARLYVPKQAWTVSGVKLLQVETKVRMLEPLYDGLRDVNDAGAFLLPPPSGGPAWEGYRADPSNRARFAKALEALDGLMDGLQATLHKKLGDAVAPPSGKKAAGAGLAAWGSKLSRSLDRVTNGRSLDSPAAYVDGLSRVFGQAQGIERHLILLGEGGAGYAAMAEDERRRVEARLRRASEFFSATVCRFVLRDVGILMDKYLKRQGSQMCAE